MWVRIKVQHPHTLRLGPEERPTELRAVEYISYVPTSQGIQPYSTAYTQLLLCLHKTFSEVSEVL